MDVGEPTDAFHRLFVEGLGSRSAELRQHGVQIVDTEIDHHLLGRREIIRTFSKRCKDRHPTF